MRKYKAARKHGIRLTPILCTLLLGFGFLCFFAGRWYLETYGQLGFDSILYTLTADMAGVQSDLIASFAKKVLVRVVFVTGCASIFLYLPARNIMVLRIGEKIKLRLFPLRRGAAIALSIAVSAAAIGVAAVETEFTDFLYCIGNPSTFYEERYQDPREVEITFPEEKRNLIYIYMESMETAFFSEEEGGALEENVIPELYQLAQENVNFSHNDGVGGFFSTSGTTWTVAAMLAQTAGIPLKTPVGMDKNGYGQDGTYLPGICSITDILSDHGYHQTLMVGSDSKFGGRYQYFTTHGIDRVFDYYTAVEDGIIPSDHYVWWGMEDLYLYEYARQELTELAAEEEPFSFTMLTVDTHHVGGYVCELCRNSHPEQYENVYSCASRQLYDFVLWLQEQDFYENTTIIIAGDHPSMDADYFSRQVSSSYDRRVYNCIINSAAQTDNRKNRQFASVDMFPTTLAALGCTIEGDRLGLGTNLFSDTPTLMEELGAEKFDDELARYSEYYINSFF